MALTTRLWVLVVATMMLAGCAGAGTKTFKEFNIDKGNSVSIDATQRVVLVTQKGGSAHNEFVVCAEPSPDALVAAAAHAALKASEPKSGISGEVSGGLSQVASSIGLRTPTIQLLRDGLYRACEAKINGVLSENSYTEILGHMDNVMVGLLAIDGLTQMRPAPLVAIGTVGGAKTSEKGTEAGTNDVKITIEPKTQGDSSKNMEKVADAVVKIVRLALGVDEQGRKIK